MKTILLGVALAVLPVTFAHAARVSGGYVWWLPGPVVVDVCYPNNPPRGQRGC